MTKKQLKGLGIAILAVFLSYMAYGSWNQKLNVVNKNMSVSWQALVFKVNKRNEMIGQLIQQVQNELPNEKQLIKLLLQAYQPKLPNYDKEQILTDIKANQAFVQQHYQTSQILKEAIPYCSKQRPFIENKKYFQNIKQIYNLQLQISAARNMLNRDIQFFNLKTTGIVYGPLNSVFFGYKPKLPLEDMVGEVGRFKEYTKYMNKTDLRKPRQ